MIWKLPLPLRVALHAMPERRERGPDKKESSEGGLKKALNKMSTPELCDLMAEIQAKILEASRLPKDGL